MLAVNNIGHRLARERNGEKALVYIKAEIVHMRCGEIANLVCRAVAYVEKACGVVCNDVYFGVFKGVYNCFYLFEFLEADMLRRHFVGVSVSFKKVKLRQLLVRHIRSCSHRSRIADRAVFYDRHCQQRGKEHIRIVERDDKLFFIRRAHAENRAGEAGFKLRALHRALN